VGRNGAGKTTLMRSVMGHLGPSQGTITFDGKDLTLTINRCFIRDGACDLGLEPYFHYYCQWIDQAILFGFAVINDQIREVTTARTDIKDREFFPLSQQGKFGANIPKNLALAPCAQRIGKSDPLITAKIRSFSKPPEPFIVKIRESARHVPLILVHLQPLGAA
jgi:ABC-type sulfate/molybdate transport systems ATPase subunit